MDLFYIASSSVALGLSLTGLIYAWPRSESRDLVYEGVCQAPLWVIVQSLESMICSPRTSPMNPPLNRYWLKIGHSDPHRGTVSATIEFVERIKTTGLFKKKHTAVLKRYGFIWTSEEVLRNNNVEVIISLLWRDLSLESETQRELPNVTKKKSIYEGDVIFAVTAATRDVINRLNKNVAPRVAQPFSGPPPGTPVSNINFPGAPPISPNNIPTPHASGSLKGLMGGKHKHGSRADFKEMSRAAALPTEEHMRRTVDWPSPQDYHESIQNPYICFNVRELQLGQTEVDNLGMPRVSSGAFASVYRVKSGEGDRAVRCFLHPIRDQEFRYKVLSSFIDPKVLPWMVSFEYLPEGIRVGPNFFPILMMDWVEGTPLNIYVAQLCARGDKAALEQVRNKFLRMCLGLRIANVAHGDLQHGNILVRNGDLVLVDYDGMYVPGLKERSSNELGHPNYQHPQRTEHDFNELTDHFSAWSIHTALTCLAEDPALWNKDYDDGESLLFHRQDFINPNTSPIFAELLKHSNAKIRQRTGLFKEFISRNIFEIPPLHDEQMPSANMSSPVSTAAQRPPNLVEPKPPPSPFLANNLNGEATSTEPGPGAPQAPQVPPEGRSSTQQENPSTEDTVTPNSPSGFKSPHRGKLPDWLDDVE